MLKSLLSLLLKPTCPLCNRNATDCLCVYCQNQVNSFQKQNPSEFWQGDLPRFVWGNYEGKLKQVIAALKYNNHPEIGEFLGYCLGETWLNFPPSRQYKKLTVIPIPLHAEKLKERGFNQAELIARGFCQITGYSLLSKGLKRVKNTPPLFGLSPQERAKVVRGAFQIAPSLKQPSQSPILLIDDIYTTGNTVQEAVKTLQLSGISVFGLVALSSPQFNQTSK